ncbi:hypothetical protein Ancab_015694 [Ancistrocladus abbreviatus]
MGMWWNLALPFERNRSCLLAFGGNGQTKKNQKLWLATNVAVAWSIWKDRNELIFRQSRSNEDTLFVKAQALSFEWVKIIGGKEACSFSLWQDDPRNMWC